MKVKMSAREQRIVKLAAAINALMRGHKDRNEAIDAYDAARIMFRNPTTDDENEGRL